MIYTVTCNPAIDRTIYSDTLNEQDVTRVNKTLRDAAGKGINTSKVLKQLGEDSMNLGFIGGHNGAFIKESLTKLDIKHKFTETSGETRENIKLIISNPHKVLELNESGPDIDLDTLKIFKHELNIVKNNDIVVMGGSVPNGVEPSIYKEIISILPKDTITILDASSTLFEEGVKANPTIIKPNLYELEQYFNKTYNNEIDMIKDCKSFIDKGIKYVFVSLGSKGAVLITKDQVLKAHIPSLNAKSTVGAGDSFVAGIVYGIKHKYEDIELLQYAASVGSASVLSERTASVDVNDRAEIFEQIKIEKLEV